MTEPIELITELDPQIEQRFRIIEVEVAPLDELITRNASSIQDLYTRVENARVARGNGRALRNTVAISGLASIAYGCYLIAAFLPWLVIGVVLFASALAGMIAARKQMNPRTPHV